MNEGLFRTIKSSANGMLPVEVYERLFDLGRHSSGGTCVEIGTAHGAGTIALALGFMECKKPFHIYTVDPFQGKYSSRVAFGSVEDNIAFVLSQFEKFGVRKYITLVAGNCVDLIQKHAISGVKILLLDADGRIDRDLALLFTRLSSNCKIVIDDIDDTVYVSRADDGWFIDQKHRIGYLLTEQLLAAGVLRKEDSLYNTGFFERGKAEVSSDEICRIALPAYRELVFADVRLPERLPQLTVTRAMKRWIANHIPFARAVYNKIMRSVPRS